MQVASRNKQVATERITTASKAIGRCFLSVNVTLTLLLITNTQCNISQRKGSYALTSVYQQNEQNDEP